MCPGNFNCRLWIAACGETIIIFWRIIWILRYCPNQCTPLPPPTLTWMCLSKIIFYADLSFDLKCNSKQKLCCWLSVLVRVLAFSSTLVCTPARGLQLQAISWFSWPTSAFCSSSHRRTAWFCLTTVQMQWGISSVSCMAPLTGIVYYTCMCVVQIKVWNSSVSLGEQEYKELESLQEILGMMSHPMGGAAGLPRMIFVSLSFLLFHYLLLRERRVCHWNSSGRRWAIQWGTCPDISGHKWCPGRQWARYQHWAGWGQPGKIMNYLYV